MAESSRVEELRKRYHENPRRFFAPLANEYRKSGFLDRAILLCQKHLGEQPGNMNGLIVYGQALFESGRHDEARGPFGAALEVDSENLIALRYLGDIARLSGDNEEAQKWYGRVLEFDRRNDEVRALFEQVGGVFEPRSGASARPAEFVDLAEDAAAHPPELAEDAAAHPPELAADSSAKTVEITPRTLASARTVEVEARPPRRTSLLDIDFDFGETASAELDAASKEVPDPTGSPLAALPTLYSPEPSEPEGDYTEPEGDYSEPEGDYTDLGESLLEPEPDPRPPLAAESVEGLLVPDFGADVEPLPDLEPSEFAAGGATIEPLPDLETAEFVVPPATAELDTPGGEGEDVDLPFLEMPDMEPAADEPSFDPTSTVPTPSTAPAIVSETMAELYLEQGFHAEAIEVYRTLIAHDPMDERLKEKLATLERTRASLEFATPTEGLGDVGERPPANAMLAEVSFDDVSSLGTPKTPAGSGRTPTSGPTAREFFAAFARRTVGTVQESFSWAVPAAASPLDALFGNAVGADDQRAANRLAGIGTTSAPSGGSSLDTLFTVVPGEIIESPSAAVPRASEKLHFDQFFSSTSTPSEPRTAEPGPAPAYEPATAEPTSTPATAEPTSTPATRPPSDEDAGPDDLGRFHGWLKGLTE